jgi:hypothetical protein
MLNLAGGPYATIRAHVALVLDTGSPEPAKRELMFWFVPKKGIIKRDFGAISTREPATLPPKSKTR